MSATAFPQLAQAQIHVALLGSAYAEGPGVLYFLRRRGMNFALVGSIVGSLLGLGCIAAALLFAFGVRTTTQETVPKNASLAILFATLALLFSLVFVAALVHGVRTTLGGTNHCEVLLALDLKSGQLLSDTGTTLANLSDVRFERRYPLIRVSDRVPRALDISWPGGSLRVFQGSAREVLGNRVQRVADRLAAHGFTVF